MKKLFAIAVIFCLSFFSGIFLTACGENIVYKISLNQVESEKSLYTVQLKVGGAVLEANNGVYDIKSGSHAKVEIFANDYGVDMSAVVVKVGNIQKEVVKNDDYKIVPPAQTSSRDHLYGSFSLQYVNTDMTISISGVKKVSSTFAFETSEIDAEAEQKRLLTQICTGVGENPEFVNLSEFLNSGNPSYQKEYDKTQDVTNTYNTFRLKFAGLQPFDLSLYDGQGNRNSTVSPIKFKAEGATEYSDVQNIVWDSEEACYVVQLGNIGESNSYTILLDFENLNYKQYAISYPQKGIGYTMSIDKQLTSYNEERTITITKTLTSDQANYEEMTVKVGNVVLEKIAGSETESEVKYLIPKGLTPISIGGVSVYTIRVGLDVDKCRISSFTEEKVISGFSTFILPNFYTENLEGVFENSAMENGDRYAMSGQNVAMRWSLRYDQQHNLYASIYDLYDYDVYVGENRILNVKEELDGVQQDIERNLGNGYTFKATFNSETQKIDEFEILFNCVGDTRFEFKNFKQYAKNINISYNFEDVRAQKVEFRILNVDGAVVSEWTELSKNATVPATVVGGYVVEFRIATLGENIGANEYKIKTSPACNMGGTTRTESDQDFTYSVFSYRVSNLQFTNTAEMQFVPAGTI